MISASRAILIGLIISGLVLLPSAYSAEQPVGVVIASQLAHLDQTVAVTGVDVYSGDALSTDLGGTLRLKFNSTQAYLLSASAAVFSRQDNKIRAQLTTGGLGFSATSGDPIEVQTPIATIHPAAGQRAYGQIVVAAPNRIVVSAYQGSLLVTGYGEERIVKAGESYNVSFSPDPEPASASPAPTPAKGYSGGSGHLVMTLIVVGASAIVAGVLYHHYADESDSTPPPQ